MHKSFVNTLMMLGLSLGFVVTGTQIAAAQPVVAAQSNPRPFYVYAHNPNELSEATEAIEAGANALEPDVMFMDCPNRPAGALFGLYMYHDDTCIPTRTPDTVADYFEHVHNLVKAGKNVASIALDIKTAAVDHLRGTSAQYPEGKVRELQELVENHLNYDNVHVNIIYSVGTYEDAINFFEYLCLEPREGIMIDGENDPDTVYFLLKGYIDLANARCGGPDTVPYNIGFGNGSFGESLGSAPNVITSMDQASWMRAGQPINMAVPYAYPIMPVDGSGKNRQYEYVSTGTDGLIPDFDEQPQEWLHTLLSIQHLSVAIVGLQHPETYHATYGDNPFTLGKETYALRVDTRDESGAGTDADITFKLIGDCGEAQVTIDGSYSDRFEADGTDYVTIQSRELGILRRIELSMDDSGGPSRAWSPGNILVSSDLWHIPHPGVTVNFGTEPDVDDGAPQGKNFTAGVQCANQVTVNTTFSDNNPASIMVNLTCTDPNAVIMPANPLSADKNNPAVFTVSEFAEGTTCSAEEVAPSVPAGYSSNNSTCLALDIGPGSDPSCTIDNTQDPVTVTVYKAYTEAHPTADLQVAVTLTCPTGTVDDTGTSSKTTTTTGTGMNRKAEFIVSDFPFTGENCVATEAVPAGYEFVSAPGCDVLQVIPGGMAPVCTITNRPTAAVLEVDKNFSDGNPQLAVTVTPLCTDAGGGPGITYTPASGQATQGNNFTTTVKYFAGATSCKAAEVDPVGYTQTLAQSTCNSGVAITDSADFTCTIFNQQDPVTIVASKVYGAQGGPAATFAAACDGPNTKVAPAGGTASAGSPLSIVVSDFPWNGTHCNVTEPVPPSGYYETDSSCNGLKIVPSDDDTLCAITNAPTIARFEVTKNFLDGNHNTPVDVTLSCFTGLPLVQTQSITESQGVNFVVEDFDHLQLDCTVTEETVPGYAPTYAASGPSADGNVGGCQFDNVGGGEQNSCRVNNAAIPVDVVIEKVWVIEGSGGDFVDTRYKLALRCDGEIAKGEPCDGGMGLDAADNITEWCRNFKSDTDNKWIAKVTPRYPATTCTVTETIYDNAIETEMGECPPMVIKANQGASCLVTNTVFFEGIPTLSQYGLAILALLMLGVGMVGFRRYH